LNGLSIPDGERNFEYQQLELEIKTVKMNQLLHVDYDESGTILLYAHNTVAMYRDVEQCRSQWGRFDL
jgi:hypothetical protein